MSSIISRLLHNRTLRELLSWNGKLCVNRMTPLSGIRLAPHGWCRQCNLWSSVRRESALRSDRPVRVGLGARPGPPADQVRHPGAVGLTRGTSPAGGRFRFASLRQIRDGSVLQEWPCCWRRGWRRNCGPSLYKETGLPDPGIQVVEPTRASGSHQLSSGRASSLGATTGTGSEEKAARSNCR